MKKYKTIKKVLKDQIDANVPFRWTWNQSSTNEEFVCVYKYIPSWSKELYTAKQLLDKIKIESQD